VKHREIGMPSVLPVDGRLRAVLVPLVFFGVAAFLWAGEWTFQSPITAPPPTPAWATDIATVRHPNLHHEIKIGDYTFQCSTCHRVFPTRTTTGRTLTQHRDIKLEHGINDRCLNCHNRDDRNAFVTDDGGTIPFDQPQLLCARCHGPVYRDWQAGVHGREDGYWDRTRGRLERRLCTECHDPHIPPFPPMTPAPPPHTLRMGTPVAEPAEPPAATNPLLIYRQLPSVGEGEATPAPAGAASEPSSPGDPD